MLLEASSLRVVPFVDPLTGTLAYRLCGAV